MMNKRQLYQHLIETAEKLGITVSEQNFRATSVNARSGLCQIKDRPVFIMDKHLQISEKVAVLAACLRIMNLDNVYIVPAVRQYLESLTPEF